MADQERLDCGHPIAGRSAVHYCGDCLERIVREKEEAEAKVKTAIAQISDLAQEIKALLRQVEELKTSAASPFRPRCQ